MKHPFPIKTVLASFLLGVIVTTLVFIPLMERKTQRALEYNFNLSSRIDHFLKDNPLPYEIPNEKSAHLIKTLPSLEFGMSFEEVEALLGKPDRKSVTVIFHSDRRLTTWLWYFLVENPRKMVRGRDKFIQVNFNTEDEYFETLSIDVPEVEERRGPNRLPL